MGEEDIPEKQPLLLHFRVTPTTSFPGGSDGKASAYSVEDPGSIPGLGRSPGEANGKPLQYSCLENPMDGEAWWVQRVGHNWAISLSLSSHQIKRKESLPVFHQRFPPSHRLAPPGDTALSMCGHRCYSPCVNPHHSAFRYGSLETRSEIFLIHNFWFILFLSKWQELWGSHLLVIQISNWSLGKGLWKLGKQSRTRNYMALEQASLYGTRRPDHSRPPPSKALKVAGQNQKLSDTQRSRCQSHYELWIFPEINHQLLNLIFKKQYTIL